MAHSLSPTRITALPQGYDADEAAQWANIDRTGATSTDQINFVGALTEHQADATGSVEPAQGWALLKQALSTTKITAGSTLGVVVDLNVI